MRPSHRVQLITRRWNTFSGSPEGFGEYEAPPDWEVVEVLSFESVGGNDHVLKLVIAPVVEP